MFSVLPGWEWRSEHWQLSVFSAFVYGVVAERCDLRRHHGGHEEVKAYDLMCCWVLLALQENVLPPKCAMQKNSHLVCFNSPWIDGCCVLLLGSQTFWRTWLRVLSLPSCFVAVKWKQTPTKLRSSWRKNSAPQSYYCYFCPSNQHN